MKIGVQILCMMIACSVFILAACNSGNVNNYFSKEESYTLKVLYSEDDSFFANYGNYINAQFPQIHFEIIPLNQIYESGSYVDNLKKIG